MNCSRLLRLVLTSLLLILLPILVLPGSSSGQAPDGKALYKQHCTTCHSMPGKGVVVGPDLKDVHKRRKPDWLLKWIKSPATMIKSGDPEALAVYEEFKKQSMSEFAFLSDEEIKAIVAWIEKESTNPEGGVKTPVTPIPLDGNQPADKTPSALLYILLFVLLTLVFVFGKIRRSLANLVRERKGLAPLPERGTIDGTRHWLYTNKKYVALSVLLLTLLGMREGWYTLKAIGVNDGYQPEQPIAFSHKVHAGENGIDCKYCHSGAEKSKTAGVPSANVCMNCHKYIKEGTMTGTAEIEKIYKALDYDPATQTYGNNPRPIVWTRVHNLPDLAYFNHSQHVKVAGIECQTCHGKMEEQTVANQFAPLTMGWCVDCHRTTEVKMEGNDYYKELHAKLAAQHGKDAKITVEKIGGLECSRCHY